MSGRALQRLNRRERQVLEAVYRLGQGSVGEVQGQVPDPPSYSAVRTHLRILTEKGYLRHEQVGRRYVYHPTVEKEEARRSALRSLLETFFDGSVTATVSTLLQEEDLNLSSEELDGLEALIEEARGRAEG
jgi:predicted transcriptional regulator